MFSLYDKWVEIEIKQGGRQFSQMMSMINVLSNYYTSQSMYFTIC